LRLTLTFLLPRDSDGISGGNIYNDQLIRALRAEGQEVTVLSIDEGPRLLARRQPGCYVVDTLNLREILTLTPAPGQQLVLLVHHLPSLEPGLPAADPSLGSEAAALARCRAFVATSPFTARLLASRGFAAERILTLTPAAPVSTTAPRPYRPPLRALMVGNLIPRKAVLAMLEALAPRLADGDDFTLDVVGRTDSDPAYAGRCQALLEANPRLQAHVRLRGPVAPDRMAEPYGAAGLFVSAAEMETYGMALAEARAHRLPILALDRGHVASHLADGHPGRLLPTHAALADALLALARDPIKMAALFADAQQRSSAIDGGWPERARRLIDQLARWNSIE
jgi:glycosyltransferase involved in cell wall biosynthesis